MFFDELKIPSIKAPIAYPATARSGAFINNFLEKVLVLAAVKMGTPAPKIPPRILNTLNFFGSG